MNVVTATTALPTVFAGSWRFTLVSIAGFAPWIVSDGLLGRHIGEPLLYALCLVSFVISALVLLPGLLDGPARRRRTAAFFIPAFTAYAVVWCACWFTLGGRPGEISGIFAGGTVFAVITVLVLGWPRPPWLPLGAFVVSQAAGYFGGGALMAIVSGGGHPGVPGMVAWGLGYGIGFGAGLGWLVHACTRDGRQAFS